MQSGAQGRGDVRAHEREARERAKRFKKMLDPQDIDRETEESWFERDDDDYDGNAVQNFAWPRGTQVRIHGIKSKKELNGKTAFVEAFDFSKGRYSVGVGIETCSLKPENLTQHLPSVKLTGLGSRKDLNGSTASIIDFDDEKKRYLVQLLGDDVLSILPQNITLPLHTRIRVCGLESESGKMLNGLLGQIVAIEDDRYLVKTKEKEVKLKRECVAA